VKKRIRTHRDLEVYRKAFDAAMRIFALSKRFPAEERYSLYGSDSSLVEKRLCKPCGIVEKFYRTYDEILGTLVGMISHSGTWILP
jgi:hypothetical protein